jgi:hypothetical protein
VLAIEEINRGFDFQAEFANNFGGCVSRLSGGVCWPTGVRITSGAFRNPLHHPSQLRLIQQLLDMSTNGIKPPDGTNPEQPNAETDGTAREKVCPPLL